MVDISFRKLLKELSDELSEKDLAFIKFACSEIIPPAELEKLTSGINIWKSLEQKGHLGPSNFRLLAEMLHLGERIDLYLKLCPDEESQNLLKFTTLTPFRVFLCKFGKLFPHSKLEDVQYLLGDLPTGILNRASDIWNILWLLENDNLLSENNLDQLSYIADGISNLNLKNLIAEYQATNMPGSSNLDITMNEEEKEVEEVTEAMAKMKTVDCYDMNSKPKGFCVIFNNHKFDHIQNDGKSKKLEERLGNAADEERLKKQFAKFGFKVDVKINRKADEMRKDFTELQKNSELSTHHALIIIILSHGNCGFVYGVDGRKISVDEITEYFKPKNCKALYQKPKLFFVQTTPSQKEEEVKPSDSHEPETDQIQPVCWPNDADIFIGYTTKAVSCPIENEGSLYMKTFVECLEKYGNKEDLLSIMTEVMHIISEDVTVDEIPFCYNTLTKKVYFNSPSDTETSSEQKSLPCYDMNSHPRGFCIIINNEEFVKTDETIQLRRRPGSSIDAENLEKIFNKLGFKTSVERDCKLEEMEKLFEDKTGNREELKKHCAIVIIILSHGERGVVYSSDGYKLSVDEITGYFKPKKCPDLSKKPKLFFLQTCQGQRRQEGRLMVDAATVVDEEHVPENADILIGYATVPGFVSYRKSDEGTFYVNQLVSCLEKFASTEDLLSIMTEVNKHVITCDETYVQVPLPHSTLTQKVYLKPTNKPHNS